MRIKFIFLLLFLILFSNSYAQNKQVLFGFSESPQTLLLNPGAETNYRYHSGVPLLSGLSINIGSSNLILSDLFSKGGIFNDKVTAVIDKLTPADYLSFNTQIEILNLGYRLDDKTYISAGFYNEIDFIGYFPKDVAILLNEGNGAYINKNFSLAELTMRADVLGVLHAGITRKISDRLTLGGRFKIYSSSLNVNTNNNSGTFTTNSGVNNILTHSLSDVNFVYNTSGVYDGDLVSIDGGSVATETFLGGNLGFGLDFGLTYHISPQLQVTASILDLGYISYSNKIKNKTIKGSYNFDGIDFQFDSSNPNYWSDLTNDFNEKVPRVDNSDTYSLMRPTKIYSGLKYSYGKSRIVRGDCYNTNYKEYYSNAIGVQLFSVIRPLQPHFALTGFYEKIIGDNIQTKFTYTIDDFSYSNIGFGLSTNIGKVNTYFIAGNILDLGSASSAKGASLQLGMNLIFK